MDERRDRAPPLGCYDCYFDREFGVRRNFCEGEGIAIDLGGSGEPLNDWLIRPRKSDDPTGKFNNGPGGFVQRNWCGVDRAGGSDTGLALGLGGHGGGHRRGDVLV